MRVLIRKLTRTFLTVSIEDLGKRVISAGDQQQQGGAGNAPAVNGSAGAGNSSTNNNNVGAGVGGEAEKVVLGMIEDCSVFAKINQRDGMVRFLDEDRNASSSGGGGRGSSRGAGGGASILELIEGKVLLNM